MRLTFKLPAIVVAAILLTAVAGSVLSIVIGRHVLIEHGAQIEDSVVMDGTVIGSKARLRRVVADRFNVIADGAEIGFDSEKDRKKHHVTKSGLVVLPRGPADHVQIAHFK